MADQREHGETTRSLGVTGAGDEGGERESGTVRVQYDPATADSLCYTLIEAVATATERELAELPPVYPVLDIETITKLVASAPESRLEVAFEYENCDIWLNSDGELLVSDGG
jgi:hypothetical protein